MVGTLGSALRKSTTLNEDLLYVALPVKKGGQLEAIYVSQNRQADFYRERKVFAVGSFSSFCLSSLFLQE